VNLIYLNSSVFWDITSYSPLKVNGHFVVKYHLHFQGRRISQAIIQCEAGSKRGNVSQLPTDYTALHGVISQEIIPFDSCENPRSYVGLSGLRQGLMKNSCELGNEHSCYIKSGRILDGLSDF
jgi:hypothetical protein